MLRALLTTASCIILAACVTTNVSTQSAQSDVDTQAAFARPAVLSPAGTPPPPARVRLLAVNKTTTAGATIDLAASKSLDQGCSPLGTIVVKVLTPPEHGTVHVGAGMTFSDYRPDDPHAACNGRRTPATVVSYRASRDYSGTDATVIRIYFPDGRAPVIRYNIAVE